MRIEQIDFQYPRGGNRGLTVEMMVRLHQSKDVFTPAIRTRCAKSSASEIADEVGTYKSKVTKARTILRNEFMRNEVLNGNKSINQAYNDLKAGWDSPTVYIIKSGDHFFKIGCSLTPHYRLAALQIGNPLSLEFVTLIKTKSMEDALELECALHDKLAPYRIRGEWFSLAPDVLHSIIDGVYL